MQHLLTMGFGPFFVQQLDPQDLPNPRVGRVVFISHSNLRLCLPDGSEVAAMLAPALQDRTNPVVVGDWVTWRPGDPYLATRRLERLRSLRRRDPGIGVQLVAANIDHAWLCYPADAPANLRRLERWLAVADDAEVDLTVVVTRADVGDAEAVAADVRSVAKVPVVLTSALERRGIDGLVAQVGQGATVALLGQSGVGKTTLTNALLGDGQLATGGVGADGRGRHTTTARHLVRLPHGAWLLDNPGVRSVGPVDAGSVDAAFPEIEALLGACRFRDCAHVDEPGCALLAAVEAGEVAPARLQSWQKLQREVAYEARRADEALARAERDKWKQIHKGQRQRRKLLDR